MSLGEGYHWSYKGIHLKGYSVAGITTSIAFPDADACFDIAQGLPFQFHLQNLLITHGHMDHCSGIPYLIGQKAMSGQPVPYFFMPPAMIQPMREIMRQWEKLEDHTYNYEFVPIQTGREYPLKPPYFMRPFPTFHRVPSTGYTIFERRKKLKEAYQGLSREELLDLKSQGETLEDLIEDPILSFTGDTRIEFLDSTPWVVRSRVLIMEVTFADEKKTIENAREWGHIHLDELIANLDKIKSEKILLIHFSARYRTKQLLEILEDKVPEHFKTKIEIFPRPM